MTRHIIVFIDEAALIPSEQQHALLIALDQRNVYAGGRSGKAPLADISVLLATTDEYRLIQPLRDRMKLVLRFNFYRPGEVAELVRQRSRALGWAGGEKPSRPGRKMAAGIFRGAVRKKFWGWEGGAGNLTR